MIALALSLGGAAALAPVTDDAVARRLVHAAFSISAMRLSARPSCAGAGFDKRDRTIGDFLASVLSATANGVSTEPVVNVLSGPARGDRVPVEFTLGMRKGEEIWRWGLRFDMSKRTGRVNPASVQCLVAG